MQYLLRDHVRRLRQQPKADAVPNIGRLHVPEQKIKHSLPDVSPEGNDDGWIETQDTQRRALSQVVCTRCGVYQAVSAFRRRKGKGRMDICKSCELVPCAACAAMLSRGNFAECGIRKYFSFTGVKHITCLVCKKQRRHARQQRLQEHKKKSKRKDYTRKHSQAHTRTCLPEDFAKWDIRRYFNFADTKNGWARAA